jgi:hypothetical protein
VVISFTSSFSFHSREGGLVAPKSIETRYKGCRFRSRARLGFAAAEDYILGRAVET